MSVSRRFLGPRKSSIQLLTKTPEEGTLELEKEISPEPDPRGRHPAITVGPLRVMAPTGRERPGSRSVTHSGRQWIPMTAGRLSPSDSGPDPGPNRGYL